MEKDTHLEKGALSFDKRKHPRLKVQVPVEFKVVNQSEVTHLLDQKKLIKSGDSKDVSAEGLFLVSEHPLVKGDIVRLDVHLPGEPRAVRAFSEVVWCSDADLPDGRHGSGISFMALKDEDQERMRRFIAQSLAGEP
jgi:Tfp pilus assembly protein PilZ